MNDYVNVDKTEITNRYGAAWAIDKIDYDSEALVSNGFRKDMVLRSNKLIYLMRYEKMLDSDGTNYLGDSSLIYVGNTIISSIAYQIYFNPKFLYDIEGAMTDPLTQSA
jgi:hypothetical protein